mgnify:CR=1 FL=1
MHDWSAVGDGVLKKGSVWTSDTFQPGPEDYKQIGELAVQDAPGYETNISVAHQYCRLRVFSVTQSGRGPIFEFQDTGPFFFGPSRPEFVPDWLCEFILAVDREGVEEFSATDIAEILFPFDWYRGFDPVRRPEDGSEWTSDPNHPHWNEWEEFDGKNRARDLVHTYFHRARELGYTERVAWNTWALKDDAVDGIM